MQISDYQSAARVTALSGAWSLNYLVPGLAGEVGELVEKKFWLGQGDVVSEDYQSEIADTFWFMALICEYLEVELETVILEGNGFDSVEQLQEHLNDATMKPKMAAFSLVKAVGEVSSAHAKSVRDDDGVLSEKRLLQIFDGLNAAFFYAGILGAHEGQTLADLFQMNIEKLYSRKNRGTLSGDGDNR